MKCVGNLSRTEKRSFRRSCRVCHVTVLLAAVEPLEARPSGSPNEGLAAVPFVSCWHIASFRSAAEFGRYRGIADMAARSQ
jgi:hypothetical protein